jgi:homoserine O-acetyltransferase/O-succinyltransferase
MSHTHYIPASIRTHTPSQPLRLASGVMLDGATVAYQTWGSLNAARDNVVWVCHALTASSDVESWWPGVFGAGRALDPTRHFIVCANVLGSCYGSAGSTSNEPGTDRAYGPRFPELTVGDMVEQQRLLADHLGIAAIQLVVGASMGGFQVLEWARREPQRVRRIALIATSWRQPPQALAQAALQCEFIRRDPKFRGGDYPVNDGPEEGLALARQLGHLTYRSAAELDRRFARTQRQDGRFQVLSYLDHQGAKLVARFDALSYLRLTEAMNRYDFAEGGAPESALAQIRQPALVVALDSDQLYYPAEQARLARALPQGRLLELTTLYGHDGFLVDAERLDQPLASFRDEALLDNSVTRLPTALPTRLSAARNAVALAVIGATGRVGRDLLQLLSAPQLALPVQVVGVANSRAALWHSEGLAAGLAAERLRAHHGGNADSLIDQLIAADRPAVLVDCTASAAIAARTTSLLEAGVAVVTPNKLAFAGSQSDYLRLRAAAAQTPAAWSASVGAGLPVLSTIRRLGAAGDRLLGVEAGLSGTLGYLLTRTHEGASLRQTLDEAIEQGLAEPDPRIDLSGEDVRRKLLILLREAGIDIEADAIQHAPALALASAGCWQEALIEHESAWRERVQRARLERSRWVYRARWTAGAGAQIGLALVPESDALAGARLTENRIVLRSEFQGDTPILIAGAGAGVRVTAAAVLADLRQVCDCLTGPATFALANWSPARARRSA